jgi:hypothetical protein
MGWTSGSAEAAGSDCAICTTATVSRSVAAGRAAVGADRRDGRVRGAAVCAGGADRRSAAGAGAGVAGAGVAGAGVAGPGSGGGLSVSESAADDRVGACVWARVIGAASTGRGFGSAVSVAGAACRMGSTAWAAGGGVSTRAATVAPLRPRRGRAGSNASSRPTQKWCLRTELSATTVMAGSANSSSGLTWQQLAARPKRSAKRVAASARRCWGETRRSASYQRSPSFMAHSHRA